MPTVGT